MSRSPPDAPSPFGSTTWIQADGGTRPGATATAESTPSRPSMSSDAHEVTARPDGADVSSEWHEAHLVLPLIGLTALHEKDEVLDDLAHR